MIAADGAVVIGLPPEEVFAFLADFRNDLQWRSQLVSMKRTSSQGGLASTWRQVAWGGPSRVTSDFAVTTYEPPRRLTFHSISGPAEVTGDWDLQPRGAGTRVAFTTSLQLRGLLRTLEPALDPLVRFGVQTDLHRLKTLLERGWAGRLPA